MTRPHLSSGGDLEASNHDLHDNRVLDDFWIPFGEWVDQTVDWMTVNLGWLFSVIEWPFDRLNHLFVEVILRPAPWLLVVAVFFILGTVVRNVRVGLFAAAGLSFCGLLGNNYWLETVRTIGFVGVSVALCVIIAIPAGIACGLFDPVWKAARPLLDAMQVVHSFVYMLPFIYFFGVGEVSATMVTMVFAIPPLIRLTNLGIRQVPADVLEASRAYGASERRVLFDVQLPLARPAIMTGVNQTLLLAISMLGIAAIMGAGGLGRLLFNALQQQSVALGSASGLAFFLVAVVLDRISQPEETDRRDGRAGIRGSIIRRIRLAWMHRRDPERLLPDQASAARSHTHGRSSDHSDADDDDAEALDAEDGGYEPSAKHRLFVRVTDIERPWMLTTAVGGFTAIVSAFLTWTEGSGFMSAYGRSVDAELSGQSFSGLSASGGSWYGILTLALGATVLAAVLTVWWLPGRGPRILAVDGAVVCSLALLVMMACYLLAWHSLTLTSDTGAASQARAGIGAYIAMTAGLAASAGSLMWMRVAPSSPRHPLSRKIEWPKLICSIAAVTLILTGMFSGWSYDRRPETERTVDAQRQAELDEIKRKEIELREQAKNEPHNAAVIAAELTSLLSGKSIAYLAVTNGISSQGPRLGLWTMLAGLIGFAAALPAVGVGFADPSRRSRRSHGDSAGATETAADNTTRAAAPSESVGGDHMDGDRRRWLWSAVMSGTGSGISAVALGWILTHVRSADSHYVSGVGSFLALLGGLMLTAIVSGTLREFHRSEAHDPV